MKEKKEFYSVPELAGLMHMSRVGVFKKIQKGEIKAKKIGKAYAVPASEADVFIVKEEKAEFGEVAILRNDKGVPELEIKARKDSVWLSLNQLAELFGRDKTVINKHMDNILEEGELDPDSVIANFTTTGQTAGALKPLYYSLEMAIALGFRMKSRPGTEFRKWAAAALKNYLIKGYSINEKSLKAGQAWLGRLKKEISAI
jgi:biotin operon repressor